MICNHPMREPISLPSHIMPRHRRRYYGVSFFTILILVVGILVVALVIYSDYQTLNVISVEQDVWKKGATTTNAAAAAASTVAGSSSNSMKKPKLPLPVAVWQQYKEWHSVDRLEEELQQQYLLLRNNNNTRSTTTSTITIHTHRTFAVAYYSCPHRSGNFLHSFFNSMIWAIAWNRTLLWAYDDATTAAAAAAADNTISNCNAVLQRASWLPSYEEYKTKFQLPEPVPVLLNTRRTIGRFYTRQEQLESFTTPVIVIFPQIPDLLSKQQRGHHPNHISYVSWWEDPARLTSPRNFRNRFYYRRTVHVSNKQQQQTLQHLYDQGLYFLYGMLFRDMFTIILTNTTAAAAAAAAGGGYDDANNSHSTSAAATRSNNNATSSTTTTTTTNTPRSHPDKYTSFNKSNNGVSIALHSRHPSEMDDGSNIQGELKCLRQYIQPTSSRKKRPKKQQQLLSQQHDCVVYLMSDRAATLEHLAAWLTLQNCTAVVQQQQQHHDSNYTAAAPAAASKKEHGPFAGAAFLQDLQLASAARTAVIGDWSRSSSVLLLDLIEYDQRMEAFFQGEYGGVGSGSVGNRKRNNNNKLQLCSLPDRTE